MNAGENFARSLNAPTSLYNVRKVLRTWAAMTEESKSDPPSLSSSPEQLIADLSALRLRFFTEQDTNGASLVSIVAQWRNFLKFLPFIVREGAILRIDHKHPAVVAPNGRDFEVSRDEIGLEEIRQNITPRSYRFDLDSYNDELFEDISINASTEEALADFEKRLGVAVKTIYDAAICEFDELVASQAWGQELVAGVDYASLKGLPTDIDASLGISLYEEGHPDALANLLALISHEMGGIPKPWGHSRTYTGERPQHLRAQLCAYIIAYGKNRLLPYLGLMSSTAAISCILLLMMEHPNLNASTILNLEIDDDGERVAGISSAGERDKVLDTLKLRARKIVSGVLTPISERVLEKVVEWTHPIRMQLVEDGHIEMARRLWVGMSSRDYHLTAFSAATLTKQIGSGAMRRFENPLEPYPMTSFVQRHPEITPWAGRLNLKALRKNMGILDFMRSSGDLVRLAKLLGHKSVKTTIKSYVPLNLRLALYERQIRRHQNLLISTAFGEIEVAVPHTDFNTTEELHAFLGSILDAAKSEPSKRSEIEIKTLLENYLCRGESHGQPEITAPFPRLVINRNPIPLAVAFLYADHLSSASNYFLDRPDEVTRVPPRFWRDFAESVRAPLPDALYELCELVQEASQIAVERSREFLFPVNG